MRTPPPRRTTPPLDGDNSSAAMIRRWPPVLAALVAVALIACGGSDDSNGDKAGGKAKPFKPTPERMLKIVAEQVQRYMASPDGGTILGCDRADASNYVCSAKFNYDAPEPLNVTVSGEGYITAIVAPSGLHSLTGAGPLPKGKDMAYRGLNRAVLQNWLNRNTAKTGLSPDATDPKPCKVNDNDRLYTCTLADRKGYDVDYVVAVRADGIVFGNPDDVDENDPAERVGKLPPDRGRDFETKFSPT